MPTIYDAPEEYDKLLDSEKAALQKWIELACVHTGTKWSEYTSYQIKHAFESVGFYVTNGQFKGAMFAAGYFVKDIKAQNWIMDVGTTCTHRPRISRKTNYPVITFECPYGYPPALFPLCHATHEQHIELAKLVEVAIREDDLRRSLAQKEA